MTSGAGATYDDHEGEEGADDVPDDTGRTDATGEPLLERIEAAAAKCLGSTGNPRYFATMLAGCFAGNPTDELAALDELAQAAERIERRLRLERARGMALAAAAELAR